MEIINTNENLNITELKKYKFGRTTGMSQHTKKLQAKGLIDKKRSDDDDRIVKVNITYEGIVVFGKVKSEVEDNMDLTVYLDEFFKWIAKNYKF